MVVFEYLLCRKDSNFITGITQNKKRLQLLCYFLVTGVCYGLNSGQLRISYHVGACHDYSQYGDAYTGYLSSFHFFVEEIVLESKKDCVVGTPMVCN